jgi:ubiquinone/menaquinone biosynthesis C-methylase UbiE
MSETKAKGDRDSAYLQFAANFLAPKKERTYALMQIQLGHKVIDVGCGPATDTIPLAQLVGPTGQVVGVDNDEAMVDQANKRAEKAGVSKWVKHMHADAQSLPFDPSYFDSCRSERLFQHLLNPARALAEISRVTKSGGWIVVYDTDWGTLSMDTVEVDIERRLVRFAADKIYNNGYAGRQLYRLFKQQNLLDIFFEAYYITTVSYAVARQIVRLDEVESAALKAGNITADELQRLHANFEQADREGVFFAGANMVMVSARKP